ncbi:MAG: M20/M25/M40 family metallo-hydrolase [Vicingaceae bacterium]|nr:M20/M25/M40 family metallo-hydrolase [Vicingaceae bacterium]
MQKIYALLLVLVIPFLLKAQEDSLFIRSIYDIALEKGHAYKNLEVLCKQVGARITGSAEAQKAVEWGYNLLSSYGFDTVYLQEINAPYWKRGTKEAGWISTANKEFHKLNLLALGGSIATNGLLKADIVEVADYEALKTIDKSVVNGKVVFINQAFDQKFINTFSAYGYCYPMRAFGAIEASKLGAKAVIIRSMATPTDNHPHTGSLVYEDKTPKIPAAAISTADADLLSAWLKQGDVSIALEMDCKTLLNVTTYNVIAEMKGKDDQIITFGGHLDSWDVGEGAHDDGAGIVHSIEALRILKTLNYQPQHTLRCVLFMNEENGNFGGKTYAKLAKQNKEKHLAAIESDRGGFLPLGYDVLGSDKHLDFVKSFDKLLFNYDLTKIKKGYSGVDIMPLREEYPDMLQIGIAINSQLYFNYHHAETDVFEAVNKRELEMGAGAMATIVYLLDKYLKN